MSKFIFLSHYLNSSTPAFGGSGAFNISIERSISKGDSCNTRILSLTSHSGTHIDFPNHFSDAGKTLELYTPDFWIFNLPFLLEYNAKEEEVILLDKEIENIPKNTDFLMIKTGFQKYRTTEKYWKNNPGLHPDLAGILRCRFKNLKVVGMDFISASSYQNRKIGRQAHIQFLVENDLLLIEDMDLSFMDQKIIKIICLPLLLESGDGAPVTILAKTV